MLAAGDPRPAAAPDTAHQHLRGSSLLLAGRLLSMGIHFAAQVLIVRHLSNADYGALAYALGAAALLGGFATLGLPGGLSRVVPTHHERRDSERMLGALVLAAGAVTLVGSALLAAAWACPEVLVRLAGGEAQPVRLLLILLFALPVEALERLAIALFASFARTGAIFFRRHVLAPALRLGTVLLCMALGAPVAFLAYGYVAATALGLAINGALLLRLLRSEGVLARFRLASLPLPFSELARFALPLLAGDLVALGMPAIGTLVLGYQGDPSRVASFRVILPAANLNTLVMGSFALLYTPALARLLARGDSAGIDALYWRTAVWMAVFSFPVFCLTSSLAQPLTRLLYGERYSASAPLLQILAVAYYLNAALGFNQLTLRLLGRLRFTLAIDALAIACNLALALALVPRHGPLGAALATAGAMIFQNLLAQAGLRRAGGIRIFEWRCLSFHALLGAAALALFLVVELADPELYAAVSLAALVSLFVLLASRRRLEVEKTFPELLRLPLAGPLLAPRRRGVRSRAARA